jgi:hypothetical protein
MILYFSFVKEKELLPTDEWQHVEADYKLKKLFKQKMMKKNVNPLSPHTVYTMDNPHWKILMLVISCHLMLK